MTDIIEQLRNLKMPKTQTLANQDANENEIKRLRAGLEEAANSLGWCARRLQVLNYEKPALEFEQKARDVLEGK